MREALFKRVAEIGERNARRYPELSSDDVLNELEATDEEQNQAQTPKG